MCLLGWRAYIGVYGERSFDEGVYDGEGRSPESCSVQLSHDSIIGHHFALHLQIRTGTCTHLHPPHTRSSVTRFSSETKAGSNVPLGGSKDVPSGNSSRDNSS